MHYAYIDEVWSQDPISKAVGPSPYPSPPPPPKKSPTMEVVRQQRPAAMDRSPQDVERTTVNNIAVYLESVYKTYGLDSLLRLMPSPVALRVRESFTDGGQIRQEPLRPAETMSIFSVFMFALIAFVLYDVLKSSM